MSQSKAMGEGVRGHDKAGKLSRSPVSMIGLCLEGDGDLEFRV